MFSKEDYKKYFKSINQMEERMANFVNQAIPLFKNKEIIQKLESIRDDEIKHSRMSKELFNYL